MGIAAGASVGIAMAPALFSGMGVTAGGVAAGSVASSVRGVLYEGAIAGLFTLVQSAGTAGLAISGTALAGTVGAALGAASTKAAKCFVKEFTNNLKKGIITGAKTRGFKRKAKQKSQIPGLKNNRVRSPQADVECITISSDEN